MAVKYSEIPFEVRDVLARVTVTENRVSLPERLESKLYEGVNKVLVSLGGKWDRHKKAHVFGSEEAAAAVREAAEAGVMIDPRVNGYFPTPVPVIARMCQIAHLAIGEHEGPLRVLEPSAGQGAILRHLKQTYGRLLELHCIEPLPDNRTVLINDGFVPAGYDFLKTTVDDIGMFDRVIMNPPFADYTTHVEHAIQFLKPGGVLVSVVPWGFTFRTDRKTQRLRQTMSGPNDWLEALPDDAFKASGTLVKTALVRFQESPLP